MFKNHQIQSATVAALFTAAVLLSDIHGRICLGADPSEPARTDIYGDPLPVGAISRIGTERFHHDSVRGFAFSPDGKQIASIGGDYTIRLWDVETGRQIAAHNCERSLTCVAWAKNGQLAVVGVAREFTSISLFDAEGLKHIRDLVVHVDAKKRERVADVLFCADGRTLAVDVSGRLLAVDSVDGKMTDSYGSAHGLSLGVNSGLVLDFDPNANRVRSISLPQRKWSPIVTRAQDQSLVVFGLDMSSDGKVIGIGNTSARQSVELLEEEGRIDVVRATDGSTVLQISTEARPMMRLSPDGQLVFVADRKGAFVMSVKTGQRVIQFPSRNIPTHGAEFSPDGRRFALAATHSIVLFNTETWSKIVPSDEGATRSFSFSRDGTWLAAAHQDLVLRAWDTRSGRELWRVPNVDSWSVRLLRNDQVLVALDADGLQFWNTMHRDDHERMSVPNCDTRLLEVIPGQDTIVIRAGFSLLLIDPIKHAVLKAIELPRPTARDRTIISPDGVLFRTREPRDVDITYDAITSSADGRYLAVSFCDKGQFPNRSAIVILSVETGGELLRIPISASPPQLRFSPSGHFLFVGGKSGCLIELPTSETVREFAMPASYILESRFIGDGLRVVTVSGNQGDQIPTVEITELALDGHEFEKTDMQFPGFRATCSMDGRHLATVLRSGMVIWPVAEGKSRQRNSSFTHAPMTEVDLEKHWAALRTTASDAWPSLQSFVLGGDRSVAYYRTKLTTIKLVPPDVQALINAIEGDDDAIRVIARERLAALGADVDSAIVKALKETKNGRALKELELVRELVLSPEVQDRDELRRLRAIQSLEWIGTPASQSLLSDIGRLYPSTRAGSAARSAFARVALQNSNK
jgi:WD40 repeat protein